MDKLLPCPNCGKTPHGPLKEGGHDERTGYNFTMRIQCNCGLNISRPSYEGRGGWCSDTGEAEKAVIKAWNTRIIIGKWSTYECLRTD